MLNYQKPERDIQLRKPKKTKKQLTFKESPSQESEAHLKLSMFHLSFRVKWSSHGYLHLPDILREAEAFLLSWSWEALLLHFLLGKINSWVARRATLSRQGWIPFLTRLPVVVGVKMRSRRRKKRFVISQHCTSERSCRLFHQKCIRSLLIRSLSTFCNTSESWTAEPFPATFCLFQKGVRNKKLHKGIPEPLPPVGHSISLGNQKKK